MARHRRNYFWHPLSRRTYACAALVGYLATAIGFPLPSLPRKDHSQPFPCQDHPCGCQTAEQCWRSCCCFRAEERFAWAEAHHVEPPSYAERPAAQGWQTARLRDRLEAGKERNRSSQSGTEQTGQACSAAAHASCCAKRENSAPCCSKESAQPATTSSTKPLGRIPWMIGVAGLHCQGIATLWVSVGAVLPPPPPPAWSESLLPTGWFVHRNASPLSLIFSPPDPPPRTSCV
jgi:hypothetical protein